jgi:hypothetical protein
MVTTLKRRGGRKGWDCAGLHVNTISEKFHSWYDHFTRQATAVVSRSEQDTALQAVPVPLS